MEVEKARELQRTSPFVISIDKHKESENCPFSQVMAQINIADNHAFERQLSKSWQEAGKEGELLSLLVCELDCFKQYHENYGLQGASFALLVVALALKNICDQFGCFLGRYKQEGFAIIIKGGNENSILEIANQLQQAVEASRTEHKYSTVSNVVTVSIGISAMHPSAMCVAVNNATHALCNATAMGGNKVSNDISQKLYTTIPKKDPLLNIEKQETKREVFVFNNDLFAPEEEEAAPKMYRGHCIDQVEEGKTQKIKRVVSAPKMYRGYVVDA